MMRNEFEARTMYYCETQEEYNVIEIAYLESSDTKDEFCKKFVEKLENGTWDIEYPIWRLYYEVTESLIRKQHVLVSKVNRQAAEIDSLNDVIETLKNDYLEELERHDKEWCQFAND